MIRWNRTVSETNEIRPESEWIVSDGQQPAIISKELFDKAQIRYKSEYKPPAPDLPLHTNIGYQVLWSTLYAEEPWLPKQ